MRNNFLIFLLIFTTIPQISFAYIGPGLAISSVLIALGIVGSLLLAVLAILYYPIKRLIKKVKLKKTKRNKIAK